jgi:hypothetical protein
MLPAATTLPNPFSSVPRKRLSVALHWQRRRYAYITTDFVSPEQQPTRPVRAAIGTFKDHF